MPTYGTRTLELGIIKCLEIYIKFCVCKYVHFSQERVHSFLQISNGTLVPKDAKKS